ncbi:MAG: hypothetical protein AAF614_07970 [Chloroflexota bacterium]
MPKNGNATITPGSYATLQVKQGGILTFSGGIYNFQEWNVGINTTLLFLAPTEIRIADKLDVRQGSSLGPAPASGLNATNIIIYVLGSNGSSGAVAVTPKAANFGNNTHITANVYAPNGTLWLRQGTTATGAFLGK